MGIFVGNILALTWSNCEEQWKTLVTQLYHQCLNLLPTEERIVTP